ncbi:MAG TPA: hypothetical protein VEF06_00370 [Bryobacteraceae bacterium]|nr:hypothetical protein [Bryobacteraceae bacterium]
MRGFQSRHWGWWYLSIGLGFLLLAIVQSMRGFSPGQVAVRLVIALAFALLGAMQFRYGR